MTDKHSKHSSKETLVKNRIVPPIVKFLLAPHWFMEEKLLLLIAGWVLHNLLETKIHSSLYTQPTVCYIVSCINMFHLTSHGVSEKLFTFYLLII